MFGNTIGCVDLPFETRRDSTRRETTLSVMQLQSREKLGPTLAGGDVTSGYVSRTGTY